MAGEWLKFECSLPEKPETLAITVAMGWDDPDLTVGKLMRLFRWFDQQTIDGNAHGVTAALLDRLLGVTGFVQAVANTGWLVISSDGLTLHNFDKHNGATAKSRAQTAKRVANHRASVVDEEPCNAKNVTAPLAREEKRREEETHTSAQPTVPCPYDSIVALYHEHLPTLPRVKLMSKSRQQALRKLWGWVLSSRKSDNSRRATTAAEALSWLAGYFQRASENDFLMGRTHKGAGHENWTADLDFLLTEKGMRHVIEKTREAA